MTSIHSSEKAEDSEYFSENLAVRYNDRGHRVIFRLQTDVIGLAIKGLDSRRIVYKSYHHIAVPGGLALLYNDGISIKNSCVDHGIPLDFQHKTLFVRHELHGNREIGFYIFHSQNRLSGSHLSYNRNIDHLPAGQIEIIVNNLDSPGFGRISADITILFQSLQMGVNGRR